MTKHEKIGRSGTIIEIDESMLARVNYDKGRSLMGQI